MEWVSTNYGIALYVNGVIVGWVTRSLNGNYMYGVTNQKTTMKDVVGSEHEAKCKLGSIFI